MKNPLFVFTAMMYGWAIKVATWMQPVFLLAIRLYWGWQFFISGKGKLGNISGVTNYFTTLHIPFPGLNAYMAGCTECFGGLLLLVGLGCRVTTLPLIFTMIIAYATDAPAGTFSNIIKDQDPFIQYTAFPFLFATLIVWVFGPGVLSADGLIGYLLKGKEDKAKTAA